MGVGEEGGPPVCLSSCPFTPPTPPSTISPCIVQAVCLEKLLSTMCRGGCPVLELLLPWPSLLAGLGLGHEPCCLVSRPQPPWWDDPAGDVSKTRLCGKSDCVRFGPHFPGWGPACSFSPPQAGEAAALASLPTETAAALTSASPCPHEVSHGFASPGSSRGSCGPLRTPDQ